MYKTGIVLLMLISFAACKKQETCGKYSRAVGNCISNCDTTLAYQQLVGTWFLSYVYEVSPHQSPYATCYTGPGNYSEFRSDRTVNVHQNGHESGFENFTLGCVPNGSDMIIIKGARDTIPRYYNYITVCEGMVQIQPSDGYGFTFDWLTYLKQ